MTRAISSRARTTATLHATLMGLLLLVAAAFARTSESPAYSAQGRAILFNELPHDAILFGDGTVIRAPWQTIWRPMCGDGALTMTIEELAEIASRYRARLLEAESDDAPFKGTIVEKDGGIAGGNIDIIFDADGSVPGGALNALDDAEAYLEVLFDDPITVTIEVSFDNMDGATLGATGSFFTRLSWPTVRDGMQDDMDANDFIQDHLPTESKIPVRYNGNQPDITNESRVYFTRAAFRAAIGSSAGNDASMIFNDNINWDYDPSNGINGYSFIDVVVHEVGHALGFTSAIDFRENDMDVLDLFRFQLNDDGEDYNPDSNSDFRKRPRLVSRNKPNDKHIVDLVSVEYRMSDGSPYQASHFREQPNNNIGLMDPALTFGETHFPAYFSTADLRMFDAIGYDR